jgi:RecA-family ATPase
MNLEFQMQGDPSGSREDLIPTVASDINYEGITSNETLMVENVVAVSPPLKGVAATQPPSTTETELTKSQKLEYTMPFDFNKETFTLAEILKHDFSKVPFLVEELIPSGCISLIVGESDLGKSTLHTQLSLAIISGQETFLGKKINATYKRVLIVSTEEGIYGIGNRLQMQATKINLDAEASKKLTIITSSDNVLNKIRAQLKHNPVDLIIVDAFADVFQLDMNLSNKVRTFFNHYSDLTKNSKCSVVFIHHVGKSREGNPLHKNQILGSVGIVDKARQVIMMSRDKNCSSDRQLSILKGNYISDEVKKRAYVLKFDPESRTYEKTEDRDIRNSSIDPNELIRKELENEVFRLRDKGLSYEEIGQKVHRHKSNIGRIINKYPERVKQPGDPDESDDL